MSELLPFDINEYRADPSRLRLQDGTPALVVQEFCGVVCAQWSDGGTPLFYRPEEWWRYLRLAPLPPDKISVRAYRFRACPSRAYVQGADAGLAEHFEWASDPVDIELYPRVGK